MQVNWKLTAKQTRANLYLKDKESTEVFYGGAAGGGKSHLGCAWIIHNCIKYPGTRYLMGRAVLKNLKESTLLTFFQICKDWGIKKDEHYKYNSIDGTVTFFNSSTVYLKDLFAYPSDPEFDSLGSTEYTGAFIDEGSQITEKAKNIVMSRIRFKLEENDLIPKLLICSNPSKNFLYYQFYQPYKEGKLPAYRKFVPALVTDNPHISQYYIENLKKLDRITKERLLHGNFEYDDDPSALIEYDKIIHMFTHHVSDRKGKYMSVDVARYGKDSTTIMIWEGFHVAQVYEYKKKSLKEVQEIVSDLAHRQRVQMRNVVIDEDGIGGGIVDNLQDTVGFINNSRQIEDGGVKYNYKNLKAQCYYTLAEWINLRKISVTNDLDPELKKRLIEDLEQVKTFNIDKDQSLQILPKDKVKEIIGRSPDFSDAMMMRMVFTLKKVKESMMFDGF